MHYKEQFELRFNNGNVLILDGLKIIYGHTEASSYKAEFKLANINGNIIVNGIAYNNGLFGESKLKFEYGTENCISDINKYIAANLSYDSLAYNVRIKMGLTDVIDYIIDILINNKSLICDTFIKEDDFLTYLKSGNLKYWKAV